MKLLLDSHALLWWLANDRKLSAEARRAIADPENAVLVSAATIWELEIKRSLGRLDLGDVDLVAELAEDDFGELPLRGVHAAAAARLPSYHADPFDRMLVAQAYVEGLVCVTADPLFASYDVPTLW